MNGRLTQAQRFRSHSAVRHRTMSETTGASSCLDHRPVLRGCAGGTDSGTPTARTKLSQPMGWCYAPLIARSNADSASRSSGSTSRSRITAASWAARVACSNRAKYFSESP
jgi:hypothetical protein